MRQIERVRSITQLAEKRTPANSSFERDSNKHNRKCGQSEYDEPILIGQRRCVHLSECEDAKKRNQRSCERNSLSSRAVRAQATASDELQHYRVCVDEERHTGPVSQPQQRSKTKECRDDNQGTTGHAHCSGKHHVEPGFVNERPTDIDNGGNYSGPIDRRHKEE